MPCVWWCLHNELQDIKGGQNYSRTECEGQRTGHKTGKVLFPVQVGTGACTDDSDFYSRFYGRTTEGF